MRIPSPAAAFIMSIVGCAVITAMICNFRAVVKIRGFHAKAYPALCKIGRAHV